MERSVRYEESTPWPGWMNAVVIGSFAAGTFAVWKELGAGRGAGSAVIAGAAVVAGPLLLRALFGRLRVQVTPSGVRVGFGDLQWLQKHVPFSEIVAVEPVRYSPLREFGGWGIRFGLGGKRAWTIRGNRAVRLDLSDGKQLYVGSETPDRLAERIRTARGGER